MCGGHSLLDARVHTLHHPHDLVEYAFLSLSEICQSLLFHSRSVFSPLSLSSSSSFTSHLSLPPYLRPLHSVSPHPFPLPLIPTHRLPLVPIPPPPFVHILSSTHHLFHHFLQTMLLCPTIQYQGWQKTISSTCTFTRTAWQYSPDHFTQRCLPMGRRLHPNHPRYVQGHPFWIHWWQ